MGHASAYARAIEIIRPVSLDQNLQGENGSPSRARTYDKAINSRLLYQLSYRGTFVVNVLGGRVIALCSRRASPLQHLDYSEWIEEGQTYLKKKGEPQGSP